MIKITIKTDNDAFMYGTDEVSRILRDLADKIEGNAIRKDTIRLADMNGNVVGEYVCTKNREVAV